MNLPELNRTNLVVGVTLAAIAVLLLMVLSSLWNMRAEYSAEIERLEPQIARLQGIAQSHEQLQMANEMLDVMVSELAYPATGDNAIVAAAMQQRIRQLMSGAGFTIAGSQILPASREGNLQLLRLDLTVTGNVDALDTALLELRELRPVVIVESVELKPARASRQVGRGKTRQDPRNINGRFKFISLRVIE